jgi:putative flippase GtrA
MNFKQPVANTRDALFLRGDLNSVSSVAARQMVSSGLGALADIIVFQTVLYTGVFGLHGAVNAGFTVCFFVVYFGHRYYTFRHIKKYKSKSLRQIILFLCASMISLGLGHIIVRFLVMTLGFMPVLARAISIAIIFFYSLFVTRRFIFAAAEQKDNQGL